MKKILLSILCTVCCVASFAKDGYKIEVKFKQDIKDSFVYLAHCYAKTLPSIYVTDSGKVINKRNVVIESKDSVLGGMYMLLFNKSTQIASMILNNGDHFTMNIDTTNIPDGVQFGGSEENTRYNEYEKFVDQRGRKMHALNAALKTAKNKADTQAIRNQSIVLNKEVADYWSNYSKKYPNTFLSHFFDASTTPKIPEGKRYLEDGKTLDSTFTYTYYKQHYWDHFDFTDNRLINAPLYDSKLNEYFNNLVLPVPDSFSYEADKLLAVTRPSKEFFKYTLQWLTTNTSQSKIMGLDESFVHLVENYHMKGDAYWLDSAALAKYEDRAKKIAPNVLGNQAPELICQDIWTLKDKPLLSVKSKYTLLILWSIDCGHCLKEIPLMDSLYNATLKAKGITVYSVIVHGELPAIQKKIKELKLEDWTNVVDVNANTGFRDKYDVYTTPKIYLIDENKKIVGKDFSHENMLKMMEINERRKTVFKKGN